MTKQEIADIIKEKLHPGTDRGSTQGIIDTNDIDVAAQAIYDAMQPNIKYTSEKIVADWEHWDDAIIKGNEVDNYSEENGKVILHTKSFGIIDYYIKANRLLVRKENKWHDVGVNWMIKNLL